MALFRKTIEKLSRGLARTKERFLGGLKSLLTGRRLDEDLLDEIEQKLIEADMGVATALRIREDLHAASKEGRISRGEEVIDFLKTELKTYWPEADRTLHFAAAPPTVTITSGWTRRIWRSRKGRQISVSCGVGTRLPGGRQ